MAEIRTFSLSRHRWLFSVPDSTREYIFVQADDNPYLEEPYRSESYAIAWLKAGGIHLQAGLTRYDIAAPAIITLGPAVIRSFRKSSDLLQMDIIFFKDAFLLEKFFLLKYDFFENSELHVLPLAAAFNQKVKSIFGLIEQTPAYHEAEIIRSYIFALIYELDGYFREQRTDVQERQSHHPLFVQFRRELSQHYMQERKLDFYAKQLHVTPKYLSAAVKKQSGKSAGEWIDETITLEAKVLLQNKTLSVADISQQLNFSDQSVFGKFFRVNAGMTPLEYRKLF